jgi:phage transcriptional regulator|nr:MAG TPA: protein of unknown function (UPF0137) [Caudoviricetes sp.]
MSRKAAGIVSEDAKAMDVYAEKNAQQALVVQQDDKRFLAEGEKYNLHICLERAKESLSQIRRGLIRLGGQLILLKDHEPHGYFMTAVEELGITVDFAERAMVAARQFGENPEAAERLGNTKIVELSFLTNEEANDLASGKKIEGVGSLDEIERMTTRELRAALREEKKKRKEERDAQEAAISQKEKKLNELEMELRYREPPTKEQLAQAALDELKKKFFLQVGEASHALHSLMLTIIQAQEIPDVNITQLQGFITLEPEGLLSSIFDYSDTLDEMIENICPARAETNAEAEEMQYAEPVED